MGEKYEIRTTERQKVAAVRRTITPLELGDTFGELFPKIYGFISQQGIAPAGPAYGRYHAFTDERVDVEVGVPVASSIKSEGEIIDTTLPETKAVFMMHSGSYDTLKEAHENMIGWVAENGLEVNDAPWESYVVDMATTGDAEKLRTELVYPIK